MDRSQLNDRFVAALRQQVQQNERLVSALMEMLSLGKEAIYRRLRSEVPFTFDEVECISLKFGISTDELIFGIHSSSKAKWAVFDTNLFLSPENYQEQYCRKVQIFLDIIHEMQHAQKSMFRCAANTMPTSVLLQYERLSLFWFYKWAYLTQGVQPGFLFSKMTKSEDIRSLEKQYIAGIRHTRRTLLIVDGNLFRSFIDDVLYFFNRGLISATELMQIRDELVQVITYMETVTATGVNEADSEITVYLSNISLDSTYVHFEYDHRACCMHRTYFVDTMDFANERVCRKQLEWIESLKRYSTLITQSGEEQRFDFFDRQRALVERLST